MDGWAIEARGVSKAYGSHPALTDVDLVVRPGVVHGLLGPNGAGKTTLLAAMLGLVRPDTGTLRILGREVEDGGVLGHPRLAGTVEGPRFYPYLTARRNLQMLAAYDGGAAADRIAESLARVGLTDRARQKVGGLSLGLRQRLGIAAALLRAPAVLLLDEPSSGLDPGARLDLRRLLCDLAADGMTVVLSSHDMAEVDAVCSDVTVLHRGAVAWAGLLTDLRAEAPQAVHRLHTSDDARAVEIARAGTGPEVETSGAGDGLVVRAADLDAYVLALGRAGIAVRSLVREQEPLVAMFLTLTEAA